MLKTLALSALVLAFASGLAFAETTITREPSTGRSVVTNPSSSLSTNQWLASDVYNADVYDPSEHKIGKITPPHRVANLSPGQTKTLTAKCPGDRTLIGGGYQRTDGSTNGGVITTESRMTSPRTWRVVAHATGYGGQAVAIGYCVRSKKPRAIQVSGSTAIPTGAAGTATTGACPGGRKLVFGGFSSPPTGEIRFLGGGFNPDGTWSATGFNAGAATTLTAYGYCVRT